MRFTMASHVRNSGGTERLLLAAAFQGRRCLLDLRHQQLPLVQRRTEELLDAPCFQVPQNLIPQPQ